MDPGEKVPASSIGRNGMILWIFQVGKLELESYQLSNTGGDHRGKSRTDDAKMLPSKQSLSSTTDNQVKNRKMTQKRLMRVPLYKMQLYRIASVGDAETIDALVLDKGSLSPLMPVRTGFPENYGTFCLYTGD